MLSAMFIVICGLSAYAMYLNHKIEKEKKRNRTTQAFIAGIIRVISNYTSQTDLTQDSKEWPARAETLPVDYDTILENIQWEFSKDYFLEHYPNWLKRERRLFFEEPRYVNDGFNFMYLDFFDRCSKDWMDSNENPGRGQAAGNVVK